MKATQWLEWIGRASATSLLAGILVSGYLGVWTWGSDYRSMRDERNEWKALALKATHIAEVNTPWKSPHVVGASGGNPPAPPQTVEEVEARLRELSKGE